MGDAALDVAEVVEAPMTPEPGRAYEYYRGGLYRMLCTALYRSQRCSTMMVVYAPIEDPSRRCVTPLEKWSEVVRWRDGKFRPRFAAPRLRLRADNQQV